MSLCHSKNHVSAVLWNVLRSSDSRCFTEIKSSSKILAHFLTYYSYALVTLPHLAWGQNAIWIISDPMCSIYLSGQRPVFSCHWLESCAASIFPYSNFVRTQFAEFSLLLLQHVRVEGPNTKVSEQVFLASRKNIESWVKNTHLFHHFYFIICFFLVQYTYVIVLHHDFGKWCILYYIYIMYTMTLENGVYYFFPNHLSLPNIRCIFNF